MKKNTSLLCSVFIINVAFIIPPTDYRDSYVGNYFCTSNCNVLGYDYELVNHIDTTTIMIQKSDKDSILIISLHGTTSEVKLKNEIMYPNSRGIRNSGMFFSSDSIAFSYSAGLAPNVCSYKGKKN